MSEKAAQGWPIIQETTDPRKRNEGIREFTIQDARNIWEVEIGKPNMLGTSRFQIKGFSGFEFKLGIDRLFCFKTTPLRVSDSGQIASHDDRFNLIDDEGKRKTLRLKNLKEYMRKII